MRLLLVTLSLACVFAEERPPYVGCLSSQECGKGSCCVIGPGRFTIPRCETYGDLGEVCRPGGSPVETLTLEYPNNDTIHLTNVYYHFCPCQSGLTCEHSEHDDQPHCVDGFLENHLDYESENY